MSELIIQDKQNNIRFGLLVTTSAIALAVCVPVEAMAADRPTVWIEGGWHMESVTGSNDIVVPLLDELTTNGYSSTPTGSNYYGQRSGGFPSFTDIEKELGRSGGTEGSVSFQPSGSDWIFNLSGRYGRAHSHSRLDQRAPFDGRQRYKTNILGRYLYTPQHTNYIIQAGDNAEAHVILDFQAGKDVGIGLFGKGTESVFSFGARYAQMNMRSKGQSYAQPDVRLFGHGGTDPVFGKYYYVISHYRHKSSLLLQRSSSFQGIGPSLSWSNTTGLWGNPSDGQLALDWGANVAVLFGRQKAAVNYTNVAEYYHIGGVPYSSPHRTVHRTQSRRVTVPNVGGFAALSYRFTNAKLNMGYRADFFFGAMDRGLDAHRSGTMGFNGPYATISIGLGG